VVAADSGTLALWWAQATVAIAAKERIRIGESPFLVTDAGLRSPVASMAVTVARKPHADLLFVASHRAHRVRRAAWL
jgi:nucleotide-binding universal stress UspA family protein